MGDGTTCYRTVTVAPQPIGAVQSLKRLGLNALILDIHCSKVLCITRALWSTPKEVNDCHSNCASPVHGPALTSGSHTIDPAYRKFRPYASSRHMLSSSELKHGIKPGNATADKIRGSQVLSIFQAESIIIHSHCQKQHNLAVDLHLSDDKDDVVITNRSTMLGPKPSE
eukprot:3124920-Pleurochrysis_carterae.AAC.1